MNFYLNRDEPVGILAVLPRGIIRSNLSPIPPNALTIIILIVLEHSLSFVLAFSRMFCFDPVVSISCRQYSIDAAIKSQYI